MMEMKSDERFAALMAFQPVDRLPVVEWAHWWNLTVERWQQQDGLDPDLSDRYDLMHHFGLDIYKQAWPRSIHFSAPRPQSHGAGRFSGHDSPHAAYEALLPHLYRIDDKWPLRLDELVMDRGDAAVDAEFARLEPIARQGGFLPSVDHQTPPAVSLEQYRGYVARLKAFAREAHP